MVRLLGLVGCARLGVLCCSGGFQEDGALGSPPVLGQVYCLVNSGQAWGLSLRSWVTAQVWSFQPTAVMEAIISVTSGWFPDRPLVKNFSLSMGAKY